MTSILIKEKIRKILMKEWDPIGVYEMDGPEDEYDSYIDNIYQIILTRNVNNFVKYLQHVEKDLMHCTPKIEDFYFELFYKLQNSINICVSKINSNL